MIHRKHSGVDLGRLPTTTIVVAVLCAACGSSIIAPTATLEPPTPAPLPFTNAPPSSVPTPPPSATPEPSPALAAKEPLATNAASPTQTRPAPTETTASSTGYALRFFGTGSGDVDRVKIRIDSPPAPADMGATDFTFEWWMRADLIDNPAPEVECGPFNFNWIYGNIVFDRDRFNQDRKFGLSLAGGRLVFGVSGDGTGDATLCSRTVLTDGQWHHVAVERRRSDGHLWIFVDGRLEAEADGPDGDISYPDGARPGDYCGGPCVNSDPFLVIGAEKHDAGSEYPSYNGLIDEVRLSTVLRYASDFSRPASPFAPDADTTALWHFDEGSGTTAADSAPGGASPGTLKVGGPSQGPLWVSSDAPLTGPSP